ncbi:hypothetical protein KSC_103680 [Ktedonobacter sp. SOSP1-52]|uniref:hypothetical protein n=1 Tax=Ktedonobacter sp. SOSP1-52 TaxID=2778366 RepID=UPI001915EA0D|nr:hypothetical protein [Ktedonobacter sp. SOSP1-52]GHO71476.1 hypothetical protein KSC_103680 [Ktedonobacter sp. SOSP1-52]
MLPTIEVRWFCQGDLSPSLWRHFLNNTIGQEEAVEKRLDIYLALSGVEDLGIKLRGQDATPQKAPDKLEMKRRQEERGLVPFSNTVTGKLEHWQKWGFSGEEGTPQLSSLLTENEPAWIKVEKTRCTRRYAIVSDTIVHALSPAEQSSNSCNVELTTLCARQQIWWTLGLEKVISPHGLEAAEHTLKLVAQHILTEIHVDTLAVERSYSYPKWLQEMYSK